MAQKKDSSPSLSTAATAEHNGKLKPLLIKGGVGVDCLYATKKEKRIDNYPLFFSSGGRTRSEAPQAQARADTTSAQTSGRAINSSCPRNLPHCEQGSIRML